MLPEQSVSPGKATEAQTSDIRWDTAGFYDGENGFTLAPGYYLFGAQIEWAQMAGGYREVTILDVSTGEIVASVRTEVVDGKETTRQNVTGFWYWTGGIHTFRVVLTHTAAEAVKIISNETVSSEFWVARA